MEKKETEGARIPKKIKKPAPPYGWKGAQPVFEIKKPATIPSRRSTRTK